MIATSSNPTPDGFFVLRFWRGAGPLWQVYWVYGVGVSCALAAAFAAALFADNVAMQQLLLPVILVYTIWVVVSVWRCAPNTGKEVYTHLARGLTVAWALNVVFLLIALEFDLLARYLGAA